MNYYESIDIFLDCEFCFQGPLDCDCCDVEMVFDDVICIDAALFDTEQMFSAVTKLGREQTETLLDELSLGKNDAGTWATIDSLAMWT